MHRVTSPRGYQTFAPGDLEAGPRPHRPASTTGRLRRVSPRLPNDVLLDVAAQLDIASIGNCARASLAFDSLLSHPAVWHRHEQAVGRLSLQQCSAIRTRAADNQLWLVNQLDPLPGTSGLQWAAHALMYVVSVHLIYSFTLFWSAKIEIDRGVRDCSAAGSLCTFFSWTLGGLLSQSVHSTDLDAIRRYSMGIAFVLFGASGLTIALWPNISRIGWRWPNTGRRSAAGQTLDAANIWRKLRLLKPPTAPSRTQRQIDCYADKYAALEHLVHIATQEILAGDALPLLLQCTEELSRARLEDRDRHRLLAACLSPATSNVRLHNSYLFAAGQALGPLLPPLSADLYDAHGTRQNFPTLLGALLWQKVPCAPHQFLSMAQQPSSTHLLELVEQAESRGVARQLVNLSLPVSNRSVLHLAIEQRRDLDYIGRLLALGADQNHVTAAGDTPLHAAVKARSELVLRLLVQSNADLNLLDSDGRSPMALLWQTMLA